MRLSLSEADKKYKSPSQVSRVVTERWVAENLFCIDCGTHRILPFPANRPVADFYCESCDVQFELKSQKRPFGKKISNGAFEKKIERLKSDKSPNLVLLQYDLAALLVKNLHIVPRRFFTASLIEKRKPLSATARRAGWIGSTIRLDLLPKLGRIPIIENGAIMSKREVLERWRQTKFLDETPIQARGWLIDVMACVDKIEPSTFELSDVYVFEGHLRSLYPQNNNIRPKIRQQLQILREQGYLKFLGNGVYRKAK